MTRIVEYGRRYTATWDIEQQERSWLRSQKIAVFKHSQHPINLLINLTWILIDPEVEGSELQSWIEMQGGPRTTAIWLAGSVDGAHWFTDSSVYKWMVEQGYTVNILGFGPRYWTSWMPSWLWLGCMDSIELDSLVPSSIDRVFLSYNRKPRWHREMFVEHLVNRGLVSARSWVTFEQGRFPEVDQLSAHADRELMGSDTRFTRPEDLNSLGDLELWRQVYCVVVAETEYTDPWQITEKTWKPIVGLRPFLHVAHEGVTDLLESLGFYTGRDFFPDWNSAAGIDSTVDVLEKLMQKSNEQLLAQWQGQRPMLEHNRQRFIELATEGDLGQLTWLKPNVQTGGENDPGHADPAA